MCAEPLKWAAAGPCGHHEACASCIVRLRFVLKDNRCPFCKQAREPSGDAFAFCGVARPPWPGAAGKAQGSALAC